VVDDDRAGAQVGPRCHEGRGGRQGG
jgi:hypothetical protein